MGVASRETQSSPPNPRPTRLPVGRKPGIETQLQLEHIFSAEHLEHV